MRRSNSDSNSRNEMQTQISLCLQNEHPQLVREVQICMHLVPIRGTTMKSLSAKLYFLKGYHTSDSWGTYFDNFFLTVHAGWATSICSLCDIMPLAVKWSRSVNGENNVSCSTWFSGSEGVKTIKQNASYLYKVTQKLDILSCKYPRLSVATSSTTLRNKIWLNASSVASI